LAIAEGAAQRADLDLQVRIFDEGLRPGSGNQLLLADNLAGTFDQDGQMSKARPPSRTGVSPSRSSRCVGRSRNGSNEIGGWSPAIADGSLVIAIAQSVQKPFRRDQIGGTETLGKAVVDRLEAGDGIGGAVVIA